jgi:hypothetical protein
MTQKNEMDDLLEKLESLKGLFEQQLSLEEARKRQAQAELARLKAQQNLRRKHG